MHTIRRIATGAFITSLALLGTGIAAHADRAYHAAHIALSPVDSTPLRNGFVENIHANGPKNYAREIYVLSGAEPNASYEVSLSIWTANLACAGSPTLAMTTATLTTDAAGKAVGQKVFTPADADGLRGHTVSAMWTVSQGGTATYATDCEVVTLD
jgi:hypothetical protein